jgi:uncharacterized OB-fold protein
MSESAGTGAETAAKTASKTGAAAETAPKPAAETAPKMAPEVSPLTRYREYLARGELGFQIDAHGAAVFYPRVAAPAGRQGPLSWVASRGLGTVYATTHIAPRGEPAYNVALIDMDEGFRLMSRVESIPADQVAIGLRVRVRVHPPAGDEGPYPVFDPVEPA